MEGKVAIFDDDHDILELCAFILKQKGFQVLTQPNCSNLLETVTSFMPDVILMDNWIPETGGIEATQSIKARPDLKNIPIIYFSANNDIKSLAAKAGAAYVSPFIGRIDDSGWEGTELIAQISKIYTLQGFKTEILAASIRNPNHIIKCAELGANVCTCPLESILGLLKHPLTDIGLAKFLEDAKKL